MPAIALNLGVLNLLRIARACPPMKVDPHLLALPYKPHSDVPNVLSGRHRHHQRSRAISRDSASRSRYYHAAALLAQITDVVVSKTCSLLSRSDKHTGT